ncbi:gliding motility lipoprotein GldD [Rasiella sp. SM2506]|uniref:gliding motility lipoprotein GldD n=1 Tax=Rasiella sp. SM2506 TaxID=3423914 RepID=UPI003D7B95FC
MRALLFICLIIFFASCEDATTVKPASKLRLEYPEPSYTLAKIKCPFSFEKNEMATVHVKANCAVNIEYPRLNATLYVTYQPVQGKSIDSLLYDAQKLTYNHDKKAQAIFEQPRMDSVNKVYGMFYAIDGNAATQSQFYVTDSIQHFVQGSLYFNAKPNYDSLYPAVMYLRNDIRHIMESISWEE